MKTTEERVEPVRLRNVDARRTMLYYIVVYVTVNYTIV